jgi:hypothetical protein
MGRADVSNGQVADDRIDLGCQRIAPSVCRPGLAFLTVSGVSALLSCRGMATLLRSQNHSPSSNVVLGERNGTPANSGWPP